MPSPTPTPTPCSKSSWEYPMVAQCSHWTQPHALVDDFTHARPGPGKLCLAQQLRALSTEGGLDHPGSWEPEAWSDLGFSKLLCEHIKGSGGDRKAREWHCCL